MKNFIIITLFTIPSLLFASDELTAVETIIQKNRPANLTEIAGSFSALGSTHQIKGDYENALVNYKKSLQLRKSIGLEKTQGYATVLFLESIVEHKQGDSCKAAKNMKEVISIYKYLGLLDDARQAETEGLKEFQLACQILASRN